MKKEKESQFHENEQQVNLSTSLKNKVQKLSLKKDIAKISDDILALLDTCDQFVLNPPNRK